MGEDEFRECIDDCLNGNNSKYKLALVEIKAIIPKGKSIDKQHQIFVDDLKRIIEKAGL